MANFVQLIVNSGLTVNINKDLIVSVEKSTKDEAIIRMMGHFQSSSGIGYIVDDMSYEEVMKLLKK